VHFSIDLPESYYKGLTAEYRTFGYKRGRKVSWWEKKKGEANEPLDLMNYNLAAAYFLGLHKKNEHGWQSLRARLVPQVLDLFQQVDEPSVAAESESIPTSPLQPVHTSTHTPPGPTPATGPKIVNGRISLTGLRRGNQ
jgi:phage terminase large subunit GpA-like protein